jgi:hypothetical protein
MKKFAKETARALGEDYANFERVMNDENQRTRLFNDLKVYLSQAIRNISTNMS